MLILDKATGQQTALLALLSSGNREVACVSGMTLATYHRVEAARRRKEHLMDVRTGDEGTRGHPGLCSLPTHSHGSRDRHGVGNVRALEPRGIWRKTTRLWEMTDFPEAHFLPRSLRVWVIPRTPLSCVSPSTRRVLCTPASSGLLAGCWFLSRCGALRACLNERMRSPRPLWINCCVLVVSENKLHTFHYTFISTHN